MSEDTWQQKYRIQTIGGCVYFTNHDGWICIQQGHKIIQVWDTKNFNSPGICLMLTAIETVEKTYD